MSLHWITVCNSPYILSYTINSFWPNNAVTKQSIVPIMAEHPKLA
jgi:hypothetical protein